VAPDVNRSEAHPDRSVLDEFGVDAQLVPLAGGTGGRCFRAGRLVLKPDQDEAAVAWLAVLASEVSADSEFRLSRPVRAGSGTWTVSGWAAMTFVDGHHERGHWSEMLGAGRALHRAIQHMPKPAFLQERVDRWAVGDRVVWGEAEVPVPDELNEQITRLTDMLVEVEAADQVVHSDLCGNTLVHHELPPAIIDFSAFFRPAEYAEGILLSDAVIWEDAPTRLVEDWMSGDRHRQMLIRACLFRLYTAAVGWPDMPDRLTTISRHHAPLTEWLASPAGLR
jgi:uncharacterized protein (TIGR02569 family)